MRHGYREGDTLTGMNDSQAAEEPKEAEKPSLVPGIGSGTFPFIQFITKSSASFEDRIRQLIRQEVFSVPAWHDQKRFFSPHAAKPVKNA